MCVYVGVFNFKVERKYLSHVVTFVICLNKIHESSKEAIKMFISLM